MNVGITHDTTHEHPHDKAAAAISMYTYVNACKAHLGHERELVVLLEVLVVHRRLDVRHPVSVEVEGCDDVVSEPVT